MTGIEIAYIAVAAVAAGVSGYSSYQTGKQQEAAADYQNQVAANNRKAIAYQSDAEAERIRSKYRMIRGSQTAAYAKNGVTIDGSVSDIFMDTNMQEDLDVMATLYKGKQAIVGEQMKSNLLTSEAKNAYNTGLLNAGGAVLSGASSAIGNYPSIEP